jgi:hypothetical protein
MRARAARALRKARAPRVPMGCRPNPLRSASRQPPRRDAHRAPRAALRSAAARPRAPYAAASPPACRPKFKTRPPGSLRLGKNPPAARDPARRKPNTRQVLAAARNRARLAARLSSSGTAPRGARPLERGAKAKTRAPGSHARLPGFRAARRSLRLAAEPDASRSRCGGPFRIRGHHCMTPQQRTAGGRKTKDAVAARGRASDNKAFCPLALSVAVRRAG